MLGQRVGGKVRTQTLSLSQAQYFLAVTSPAHPSCRVKSPWHSRAAAQGSTLGDMAAHPPTSPGSWIQSLGVEWL